MEPGDWAALSLLVAGLGASAVLEMRGCRPVSTCVRTSRPAKVVVGALAIHLLFTVPGDPLTWAGRKLSR